MNMGVTVGSLTFNNPVIAASGTFGYGPEYAGQFDVNRLGGFVTKGLSLAPRDGNPPPRIAETACGMLNAIGLANLGVEAFLKDKLPFLQGLKARAIVNLYAESVDEFARLAERLSGAAGVAALEVNVSCPNVAGGGMAFGVDPEMVYKVAGAVKNATDKPMWVKLTPNLADPAPAALAAAEAGAEAVSLINTLLGMAINARTRRPKLGNLFGGLSGPAIKPVALRMVFQVARAVDIPVVGMGGICSGEDAAEFLLAGATAVQVGTASFARPDACVRIIGELEEFCLSQGVEDVSQLVGGLMI